MRIAGLLLLTPFIAFSQSAPSFEVASIKSAPPPTDGRLMIRMNDDAGRIDFSNVTLRDVIKRAYKVRDHQISGPDWLNSERFIITAKIPDGVTKAQIPAMLQTLLADRFKLTLHKEQKVIPAYALLVAKGGPKLESSETEGRLSMMMSPKGRHMTGVVTMPSLTDALSNFMDRPVVDMTELKGNYNIDLEWSSAGGGDEGPQGMRMMRPPGGPEGGPHPEPHEESADAPSIFTALQEKLGLRLDPRKEPVDLLVIDHVEKVPTEN